MLNDEIPVPLLGDEPCMIDKVFLDGTSLKPQKILAVMKPVEHWSVTTEIYYDERIYIRIPTV